MTDVMDLQTQQTSQSKRHKRSKFPRNGGSLQARQADVAIDGEFSREAMSQSQAEYIRELSQVWEDAP
ncbi:MAG TPA: hypothetical protein V6C65_22070 [Allocoleopsis sp.]